MSLDFLDSISEDMALSQGFVFSCYDEYRTYQMIELERSYETYYAYYGE